MGKANREGDKCSCPWMLRVLGAAHRSSALGIQRAEDTRSIGNCHTSSQAPLLAAQAGATTQLAAGANISKRAWGQESCDGGAQKSSPQSLKLLSLPQPDR